MWLITEIGFFSVVEKPGDADAGLLTVRSRVRGDLDALRERYLPSLGPVGESDRTDYRYRARAPRDEVAAAAARMVHDIDYGNFKSAVASRQGSRRAHVYGDVWGVLLALEHEEA